jgi:hypothetical protein
MFINWLRKVTFLTVGAVGFCALANGATVTDVKKKKKTATMDAGTDDGFNKGVSVCFLDENGVKIGCTKIFEATAETSTVKLTPKLLRKVKKGVTAELQSAAGSTAAAGADKALNRTNLKFLYILTPVPPAKYNKVLYLTPEQTQTSAESLWKKAEDSGISFLGGGLEFELGIGQKMSIAFGGRYRLYRDFLAESDYVTTDVASSDVFAQTTIKATSVGGWFDYYFLQMGSAPFYFRLAAGLDFDNSKISLTTNKQGDTAEIAVEPLAKASSSLTLLSLRLGMQFNFFFKPIGLAFGLYPVVPLAAFGQAYSATITDANSSKLANSLKADEDLKTALGHTKSSFGLEVATGLYFAF